MVRSEEVARVTRMGTWRRCDEVVLGRRVWTRRLELGRVEREREEQEGQDETRRARRERRRRQRDEL